MVYLPLCGIFGHSASVCPKSVTDNPLGVPVVEEPRIVQGQTQGERQGEAEFTTVRRRGRRWEPPQKNVVFSAGGSGGNVGRQLKEISQNKDSGNIQLSNRYGNLEEVGNIPMIMENTISLAANKENMVVIPKKSWEERKSQQLREGVPSGPVGKGKGVVRESPRDKRFSSQKGIDSVGPKTKVKSTRPTRGLIFGLTKGEGQLSESGKRLRVEREGMGRAGGVFGNGEPGGSITEMSMQWSLGDTGKKLSETESNLENSELVVHDGPPRVEVEPQVV